MKAGSLAWLLNLVGLSRSQFVDFSQWDYIETQQGGPWCPSAMELWYLRVPFASGVNKCGEGVPDGPSLPPRPPPPSSTTTTTSTVLSTLPGFNLDSKATCCTTLPPSTTDLPEYTTAPPYEYNWQTTTLTSTKTSSTTTLSATTSLTSITWTTLSTSSTATPAPWDPNSTLNSSTTTISTTETETSRTTSTTINTTITTTSTTETATTTTSSFTNSTTTTATKSTTYTLTTLTNTTTASTLTVTSVSKTNTHTVTTTSATTNTVTSLPDPPIACKPLCPRLQPTACREELFGGETCETDTLNSPCFESSILKFECPGTNLDPQRQQNFVSGHYGVKCWICSLDDTSFDEFGKIPDVDTRTGHIQFDLKFGPNMLGNVLDETPISGYAVFMTDLDGNRYSEEPNLELSKHARDLSPQSCCAVDAYTARVTAVLPEGVEEVRFEVAPVLVGLGPLGVGRITPIVEDASPFNQRASSEAHRALCLMGLLLLALVTVVTAALL
eukprot:TRINITY_DN47300_c0_g1_i1.p1 TRINITY_DN47300_c0_g1~~TRINITY_DN47300_c0_g1_i1.p1  ORF type:complete len:500 (+),score=60.68 TRINITY_DN47300_c0_g1_i1:59-1558(+)